MRPTFLRSFALAATAALVLSGCASRQDPTADTSTTATGLGSYGAPSGGVGAGVAGGQDPYVLGGGSASGVGTGIGTGTGAGIGSGTGSDIYGTNGTLGGIDSTTLGGVGQGTYIADTGLVDGGIISAAPQYSDGTIYTDVASEPYNDGTYVQQPYDGTLFDDTGVVTGAATGTGVAPFTTYTQQGGGSVGGYSFPGDTGQQSYLTTQVGNRVLDDPTGAAIKSPGST